MEPSDPQRIPFYVVASTLVMAGAIILAASAFRGRAPKMVNALGVAGVISLIGILFAKYGANFGLPWWIYYTAPMLATVLLPPLVFRFSAPRTGLYLALAFLSAPLIHACFFYGLGWGDYMPFLRLPPF